MIRTIWNWRSALALLAVAIVSGTILYSNHLADKIAGEEREKVNVWVQSLKTRAETRDKTALDLTNIITSENKDIPIIETDENANPSGVWLNLDSNDVKSDIGYLRKKVQQFQKKNKPVSLELNKSPLIINRYYYGDSALLEQVKYYPIIQLMIVSLFIFIIIHSIDTRNKSTENQVWAGMAKETAHQLGTPISSLQGWVEILKDKEPDSELAEEMSKDIGRLKLISDRFGKIGSIPKLEVTNITHQINQMVEYIKRRSSSRVTFTTKVIGENPVMTSISPLLFDWVIENLLKNALDAMNGVGAITILIKNEKERILIDVTDTGKGISKKNLTKVFKPGFTTKKRGWGLGLSLSKRIVEQYHKGHLYVRSSDLKKGTTFRISLIK
ncbi:MAG: HAMP domain-containing sensor histidine kinase [Ginsengibacter sp.]